MSRGRGFDTLAERGENIHEKDAAYNNCVWIINNIDWNNPLTTKGQRMSEHITMEALCYFLEMYPNQAPVGLETKINDWADSGL